MSISKSDCSGCYNDDYNRGLGGAKECWSFKDAKIVSKLDIHVDQPPPYKHIKPTKRPNCYKAQRWVRVDVSSLTPEGYWKS